MIIKQTINSFSARTADRLTSARRATLTMLATFLIAMTAQTAWADNDPIGSINYNSTLGAYEIKNVNNLNDLAVYVNGSGQYSTGGTPTQNNNCQGLIFKMTADIKYNPNAPTIDYDQNGVYESNFTPIGGLNKGFYGTFDGQGYTISGIRIDKSALQDNDYIGIFGYVGNTTGAPMVKNLVVSNCRFAGDRCIGAIAGERRSLGTIENCHVGDDVTVSGYSHVGGIVGESYDFGIIKGCTSAATITGTASGGNKASSLGGIVGYSSKTGNSSMEYQLTDNIFTGTITGDLKEYIGAIVGEFQDGNTDVTLTNNVYTSSVIKGIGASGTTTGADGVGAKHVYTIAAGENVTVDFAGNATTTYSPKGISVYAAGMKYDNTLYVDGTAAVNVLLSSDVPVNSYSASAGTLSGSATTGSGDAYTLGMANPVSNITITADFALWGEKDGADGSEAKPYIISTTAGLDKLAQKVNAGNDYSGKFFKLGANIEYDKNTENNFTPVGNSDHSFYGTFDGDGKSISGIKINKPENGTYQGIFGFVDGTVKNLVVSNCSFAAGQNIGAIAGCLRGGISTGTIENCYVGNDVTLIGHSFIGGIVGQNDGGDIKGCASAATISGSKSSGYGADTLGGIVGKTKPSYLKPSSTLTDNIFTGTIIGDLYEVEGHIGAIVGEDYNGTLKNNLHTSTRFGGIGKSGSTTGVDEDNARKAVAIGAASGVTIKPTGNATTYKTSGITSYADNSVIGYDSKLYAGATEAAKLTIAYTVPNGYEFNKIDAGEGVTVTASNDTYTLTMPASDVTVNVVYKAIEYTLQYNGADGATFATANPTTYTVESDAITLTNPTKDGYTFAGWTGTGLTEATTTVTIAKGSTGNREYTATWKKLLTNTDIKVSTIANQTYTGSALTPAVTVKDGTTDITSQCDIAYSNNTNVGTATVTITAKATSAAYSGETTTTFEIEAKPDPDPDADPRYEVDADGVATTTTIEDLAELALDDTMQDYVEDSKLKMTVTPKNKYWTLACGVDLLLPEGVKVYKARMNSAGTKVELTEIAATTLGGVLKANNGVLIASTPGESYDLVVSPNNSVTTLSSADAKSYGTDNELEPVLEDTHFTTEDYFILTENKFIMVDTSKDTKVPAGKAVLKVAAGSAKTRTLDVIDGETTGISSAVNSADDEVWYNLQGQRISKPSRKGVYILNGKKVKK